MAVLNSLSPTGDTGGGQHRRAPATSRRCNLGSPTGDGSNGDKGATGNVAALNTLSSTGDKGHGNTGVLPTCVSQHLEPDR